MTENENIGKHDLFFAGAEPINSDPDCSLKLNSVPRLKTSFPDMAILIEITT